MPQFTVAEAARRAGVERTTLYRKLQKGEISASQDVAGGKLIDASELLRVYAEADVVTPYGELAALQESSEPQSATEADEAPLLRQRLAMHERQVADLERRLEQVRHDKDDVIDDLRRRLDDESAERRRLTAVLTDQRPPAATASRGFFGRLFGR
ncbi:MAG: helix-turn-helix domain-containing protein [Geminicoccaceae bacterium]|nr:helix-turn-helix domain-containing protein [Geminicoccaceae bacterium]